MEMINADEQTAITNTLASCGLPQRFEGTTTVDDVLRRMGFDKKNEGGKLKLILPRGLGACEIVSEPPESAVREGLRAIGIHS